VGWGRGGVGSGCSGVRWGDKGEGQVRVPQPRAWRAVLLARAPRSLVRVQQAGRAQVTPLRACAQARRCMRVGQCEQPVLRGMAVLGVRWGCEKPRCGALLRPVALGLAEKRSTPALTGPRGLAAGAGCDYRRAEAAGAVSSKQQKC
jgi:hypothetical protein